jgi:putative copper export protein
MLDALAAIAQLVLYAGILCAIGGVFAQSALRADGEAAQSLSLLARSGAMATIVATLGAGVVLMHRLGGQFNEDTVSAVLMSSVGAAAGMRLSGAVLLLTTSAASNDSFIRGMRLSYAALIAASFIFSGHAAAVGFAPGLMACIHVSIAGWWIGSLVAMQRSCATADVARVAAIVRRFSAFAVAAIGLLIVAGIVLILTLVVLPLTFTPYLTTLAIKIGIALLVFALASYNKFRLTPRLLSADYSAVRSLRTSINVELVLIGAVLVSTAALTTYFAPEE